MVDRLLLALIIVATSAAIYLVWQRAMLRQASAATVPNGRPTILYFRSEACAPCVVQARFLQQLKEQLGDAVHIERIDADFDRERASRYRVFTVPTTLVIDGRGEVRHANYGLAPVRKLAEQLTTAGMDGDGI